MSDWISVDDELPSSSEKECRVFMGIGEQESFYRYKDGKWQYQADNGVWVISHLWEAITHFYYCPEPPKDKQIMSDNEIDWIGNQIGKGEPAKNFAPDALVWSEYAVRAAILRAINNYEDNNPWSQKDKQS